MRDGLPRQFSRGGVQVISGSGARRNEQQERGESRVPPFHGCDDSTSRLPLPVTMRTTPLRQVRATKNDTGKVIAAISTHPKMFSMAVAPYCPPADRMLQPARPR